VNRPIDGRAARSDDDPSWGAVTALRTLIEEATRPDPDPATVRDSLDVLLGWWQETDPPAPAATGPGSHRAGAADGERRQRPVTSAAVRAWARREGLRVADVGRLPNAVVELYRSERGGP
jgi:hypothetical protein